MEAKIETADDDDAHLRSVRIGQSGGSGAKTYVNMGGGRAMSEKTTNEAGICDNQLLTYPEAAKFLAISERSLWQLACDGLIPQVRIGRSVRFDISDLNAFVNQQKERSGVKLAPLVVADVTCAENVVSGRGI